MSASWLDTVRDVCLSLGLPVPTSTEFVGESDHALVLQQVELNADRLLRRGWWFNRGEEILLEPDENDQIPADNFLSVKSIRHKDWTEAPRVSVRELNGEPFLWNLEDRTHEFTKPFYADLIARIEPEDIPDEAKTYLAYQVAKKLAPIFGAVPPDEEAALAWQDLLRSEADLGHTYNAINRNPEIFLTTARSR